MNNNKRVEGINDTLRNTRFALDKVRPYKGIKKNLFTWSITYAIADWSICAFSKIAFIPASMVKREEYEF